MRVLLLDLDTLRPDHLGCYGYPRNTSPNIDNVAREGTRFERAYCSDAPCLPSRAAWVSGRFGISTGVIGHGGTAADMRLEGAGREFRSAFSTRDSLWQLFRRAGLWCASVSPFAERHSAWWFNSGFNECINPGKGGTESAEEITPHVLRWLDANAERADWLLHVNYWDPHTPYRAPAELGNPFARDPLPAWWSEAILAEHRRQPGGHGARELNMWDDRVDRRYPRHLGEVASEADFRRMIDGYDCGVRHMDNHIGLILERLERAGVLDDLWIIVTSDHGENLGELNCYGEHGTADEITHRIPLIVRAPGLRSGHVDRGLHYSLDLAPTLAELLGLEPSAGWQGRSFAPALRQGRECGRESLVLSQCCHGAMRSARFGRWLYMRVIHDFLHLYESEMLFDVEEDPHELRDLAPERPELCAQGSRILQSWHDESMREVPDGIDPLWTVMREGGPYHSRGALEPYCRRLEATGRAWAVPELRKRHASRG